MSVLTLVTDQSQLNPSSIAQGLAQTLGDAVQVLDDSWTTAGIALAHARAGIFVGSSTMGPSVADRRILKRAYEAGVPLLGVILTEEAHGYLALDDELDGIGELAQMEYIELLRSVGYADTPILQSKSLESLVDDAVRLIDEVPDEPADVTHAAAHIFRLDELLRMLGYTPGGAKSRALNQAALLRLGDGAGIADFSGEIDEMLAAARATWQEPVLREWFVVPNRHLDGATPLDTLAKFGPEPVITAIEHELHGEFI